MLRRSSSRSTRARRPTSRRGAGARAGARRRASTAASRRCSSVDDASRRAPLLSHRTTRARRRGRERTALSIVAGQPVAVHAPARVTFGQLGPSGPGLAARARPERRWLQRLAADARPEQLGGRGGSVSSAGDLVDELAAADLHQLGRARSRRPSGTGRGPATCRSARRGRRPSARRCRAARRAASRAAAGRTGGGR